MCYIRILALTLMGTCTVCASGVTRCHNKINRGDYTIINEQKTWIDARDNCVSLGMELVVMETKEEFEFIQQVLRDSADVSEYYWVGASDLDKEDSFKWLNGGELLKGITWWGSGEPNNQGGNEDCVNVMETKDFKLNDGQCSALCGYICEQSACRAKTFTITKGYRLHGNILETTQVFTLTKCSIACISNADCKSVNFGLSGAGEKDMHIQKTCELNGYSRSGHEENFLPTEGYVYADVDM